MPQYLANSPSFPIVRKEEDVVPALQKAFVRAVILRDPAKKSLDQWLERSIEFPETTSPDYWDFRPFPGSESYYGGLAARDVQEEADLAEIVIDLDAVHALTGRIADLRTKFDRIYFDYAPEGVRNNGTKLLLAKKNGVAGRALTPHIDHAALIGHFTVAGAPFNVYTGPHSQELLRLVNQVSDFSKDFQNLDEDGDMQYTALRSRLIRIVDKESAFVEVGDMVFMKGFDPDIQNPPDYMQEEAACLHRSSTRVPDLGQAAVLFW